MTDKLLKFLEIIEKIPSIIIICLMLYGYHWFTHQDHTDIVKTDGVTRETVETELDLNGKVEDKVEVYDKIEEARKSTVKPSVTLPPDADEATIQRAIDELEGDTAVSEPSKDPGTNIYSIKVRRAPHGVGIYGDVSHSSGNMDFGYGLHYRNKRWVYQIGVDQDRDFTGRIAYEVIQW